jgi:hypothetical protein
MALRNIALHSGLEEVMTVNMREETLAYTTLSTREFAHISVLKSYSAWKKGMVEVSVVILSLC